MAPPPLSPDDVALLMQRMEGAARELLGDPNAADDLVQEAWLAALRMGPEALRHPLRWMRVVMRHRMLRQRARDVLRRECEEFAARIEASEDAAAIERASTAALLLHELEQVGQPYEEVLRLRFLEERSVAEIAAATGSKAATVRSQLHRGLNRLRERLDRRAGTREAWGLCLLGAAGLEPADLVRGRELVQRGAPLPAGALAATFAALSLVGVAWWVWPEAERERELADLEESPARVTKAAQTSPPAGERQELVPEPTAFQAEVIEAPQPEDPPALPGDVARLRVEVRDGFGSPEPGVFGDFIGHERKPLFQGVLPDDGVLLLDVADEDLIRGQSFSADLIVSVRSPRKAWSKTYGIELELGHERTLSVVLDQEACELRGVIVDPDGKPLDRVHVDTFAWPDHSSVIEPGLSAGSKWVEERTDAEGRFVLPGLPPTTHLLRVRPDGYLDQDLKIVPSRGPAGGELRIQVEASALIEGSVTYEDGRPASAVPVQIAGSDSSQRLEARVWTDEHGLYQLSGFPFDVDVRVFTYDPAQPEMFDATTLRVPAGEVEAFDAVLAPTPGLRLRVVDGAGSPVQSAHVVVTATRAVSNWSETAVTDDEGRCVLLQVPLEELDLWVEPGLRFGRGEPYPLLSGVRASPEEVTITLAAEIARDGSLSGRLLTADGRPAPQAEIHVACAELAQADRDTGGRDRFGLMARARSPLQADGRFRFEELRPGGYLVHAVLDGPDALGVVDLGRHEVVAAGRTDLGDLRVPASVDLRLVRDPSRAGAAQVGLGLRLGTYREHSSFRSMGHELVLAVLPGDYELLLDGRALGRPIRVAGPSTVELER